ncbi:DUF1641 domain-containing protein [Nocardioides sp. YIM 152588]|uniref:DUF1641 domain-containing protein n=1 Tax=Nocardioides sp. YIM 152588 TaxID=3158259 RepID=UPI0032E3A758
MAVSPDSGIAPSSAPSAGSPSGADALAAQLADPQVANALASLLAHADLIAILVEGLDQMVSRSEIIGDSLLASIGDLRSTVENSPGLKDSGVTVQELTESAASLAAVLPKAAPGMVAAVESGALDRVLASDLVGPDAVDQIEVLARGFARGKEEFADRPVAIGGPLSLVRLFKDPDINRALSYFATVAKAVGEELAAPPQTP